MEQFQEQYDEKSRPLSMGQCIVRISQMRSIRLFTDLSTQSTGLNPQNACFVDLNLWIVDKLS